MKRKTVCIIGLLLLALLSQQVIAAILIWKNDTPWNQRWPKGLEAYHGQIEARSVMHGIQETVFDISFKDREQFEKAWPTILKNKSKGAPLIIERAPAHYGVSGSKMGAGVRILWPSIGSCGVPGGIMLKSYAPWPDSIESPTGELPEYVEPTKETWVPYKNTSGMRYRARADIVLVVDGKIVDLNRIFIPGDTPIIDRRF